MCAEKCTSSAQTKQKKKQAHKIHILIPAAEQKYGKNKYWHKPENLVFSLVVGRLDALKSVRWGWGDLVADVAVPVADHVEELEGQRQQARAQQVAQRSQVRNGGVVRVDLLRPHPVHHHVRHVQQQEHLHYSFVPI